MHRQLERAKLVVEAKHCSLWSYLSLVYDLKLKLLLKPHRTLNDEFSEIKGQAYGNIVWIFKLHLFSTDWAFYLLLFHSECNFFKACLAFD